LDVANDVNEFFGESRRLLGFCRFRFGPLGVLLVAGALVGSLLGSLVGSLVGSCLWQCKVRSYLILLSNGGYALKAGFGGILPTHGGDDWPSRNVGLPP
jgi:hypothetical protein